MAEILYKYFYHYEPITSNEVRDHENLDKQSRQLYVVRKVDLFLNKYVILIEIMPSSFIFQPLLLFSSYVHIYPSKQKLFTQIFIKNHDSYDLDNPENFEVWRSFEESLFSIKII